jgi:hypothetical protein
VSCALPILTLTAGQISAVPLVFTQPNGTPLNLTGSTVALVARTSFAAEEAVLDLTQDTHSNAAAGETTLEVDLSGLEESYFKEGGRLTGSLWVLDAQGQRIPYGNLTIEIEPTAKRWS